MRGSANLCGRGPLRPLPSSRPLFDRRAAGEPAEVWQYECQGGAAVAGSAGACGAACRYFFLGGGGGGTFGGGVAPSPFRRGVSPVRCGDGLEVGLGVGLLVNTFRELADPSAVAAAVQP